MILITKATSLLGSHVLYQLCKIHQKIRAIRRKDSDVKQVIDVFSFYSQNTRNLLKNVEWVTTDLRDQSLLEKCFKGVNNVYHCAEEINFFNCKKRPNINIQETKNIVNLCLHHNVEKLCYVSSCATLGKTFNGGGVNEKNHWVDSRENSQNNLNQYHAELEVWRGIEEGLNAVIINPSIIIGPGNWSKGSGKLFNLIWNGLRFYPTGKNGFVDVRDVSRAMIKLMNSTINSERFILCSENLSYKELFENIAKYLGKRAHFTPLKMNLALCFFLAQKILSIFTRNETCLSKEMLRTMQKNLSFDNQKLLNLINFSYIPISQSCKDISSLFLKYHK